MIDTARTIEIGNSWPKIIGILAGGIVLSVISASIALHWDDHVRAGSFVEFVGYVGMVFFPTAVLFALYQFIRIKGSVVTLSPNGLRDGRLAPSTIPWPAVASINTYKKHRQKWLVLTLDPGTIDQLHPKIGAKFRRSGMLGIPKGLFVSSNTLAVSFDELSAMVSSYHRDHSPKT